MRRALLVVLVAGLLVGAGCVGLDAADENTGGDDEPTPDGDELEESDREDGPDGDTETGAGTGDGANDGSPDGELEIHHVDVGQADATLLVTPAGETVLIDTGHWQQDGQRVIEYLDERGIERVDHLVATHGHADHVGGHAAVIEHFETERAGVGAAYDSGVAHSTRTYERYLDAIEDHDVDLFVVEEGDRLPLESEGVEATVLNPPAGESGDDPDANSVALAVEFGERRYLTTGDAGADAERRMVEAWADELDADVYQAGHHGSTTSTTEAFLTAVDPDVAVVSSDYDSQYGHPHDEILERFAAHGIETYWTGVHGDVVVTTDGERVAVDTAEPFSSDPLDLLAEKREGEQSSEDDVRGAALNEVDEQGELSSEGAELPRIAGPAAADTAIAGEGPDRRPTLDASPGGSIEP